MKAITVKLVCVAAMSSSLAFAQDGCADLNVSQQFPFGTNAPGSKISSGGAYAGERKSTDGAIKAHRGVDVFIPAPAPPTTVPA